MIIIACTLCSFQKAQTFDIFNSVSKDWTQLAHSYLIENTLRQNCSHTNQNLQCIDERAQGLVHLVLEQWIQEGKEKEEVEKEEEEGGEDRGDEWWWAVKFVPL